MIMFTKLLHIEWLKMRKYNAFWWIMGITALSYPGINYIFSSTYHLIIDKKNAITEMAKVYTGTPFGFPEAWHTVAYFSSWFIFIPTIVVIMFITNEYTYRTHRQNIIDGWSRSQFITSKLIDVLVISLLITVLNLLVTFLIGFTQPEGVPGNWYAQFYYTGLFFLQTFCQLSIAFFLGYMVRKAFLTLGIFLFYYMVVEPIAVALLKKYANDIGRFLPLEISDRLVPVPAFIGRIDVDSYNTTISQIPQHLAMTIVLTAIVWILCYRMNARKDL